MLNLLVVVAVSVCPTDAEFEEAKASFERLTAQAQAIRDASIDPREHVLNQGRASDFVNLHANDFYRFGELRRLREACIQEAKEAERARQESEAARVAEQRAVDEAAARKKIADETAKILANEKAKQLIISTFICLEAEAESDALKAIRQEQENSKIAGVTDLIVLRKLQNEVVAARAHQKQYRADLQTIKKPALGCTQEAVKSLSPCLADPEQCAGPELQPILAAAAELQVTTGN